jgi:hypothetical protein
VLSITKIALVTRNGFHLVPGLCFIRYCRTFNLFSARRSFCKSPLFGKENETFHYRGQGPYPWEIEGGETDLALKEVYEANIPLILENHREGPVHSVYNKRLTNDVNINELMYALVVLVFHQSV